MGQKKKQTVGYKYELGMQMVLAESVEAVLEIRHGDLSAWRGSSYGDRITYDRPKLFGGQEREGGVSAQIDFEKGAADQPQNDYMVSLRGAFVPAFRGLATLVWRRPYLGNNPYIKPIAIKVMNIHEHWDNWYPEKAVINRQFEITGASIYIALDGSGSMIGARFEVEKAAAIGFVESLKGSSNHVKIVFWGTGVIDQIERFNCTDADYDEIKSWISAFYLSGFYGTNYEAGVSLATDFFAATDALEAGPETSTFGSVGRPNDGAATAKLRKIMLFLTDGEPDPIGSAAAAAAAIAGITNLDVYAFNIELTNTDYTALLDNTPTDGVPVLNASDAAGMQHALESAFTKHADMNPAHILRLVLLNPKWRGSGNTDDIGDSFAAAADQLFDEKFGLTLRWQNTSSRAEFINLIERHIDGTIFPDRITGKWEIKLNRDDYDVEALPVIGANDIVEWVDAPRRPMPSELPNYIKLTYRKSEDNSDASLSLANLAALQITDAIQPEDVDFEGIKDPDLAARVLMRELVARTNPLWSGTFVAKYLDPTLNIGSPFILNEPRLGMSGVVCRIGKIEERDRTSSETLVQFAEDRFAIGDQVLAGGADLAQPSREPKASNHRLVEELPYYLLVLARGQTDVDTELDAEPDLGFMHGTGERPNGFHQNAKITVDAGSGWFETGVTDYSPVALLLSPLTSEADDLIATIPNAADLAEIETGSLCAIGTEYLRIDAMVMVGSDVQITFGRGCLDTVPVEHATGDAVIFFQRYADSDEVRYLVAEEIDVKLRGGTTLGDLTIGRAPTDTVTFASRAVRPYPPGNFKVSGSYEQDRNYEDITLTWAHRDRTIQTTLTPEDHADGNIGPEAGVTYQVRAVALDAAFAALSTIVDTNVGTDTSYDYNDASSLPGGAEFLLLSVTSIRDGYESWQSPAIRVVVGPKRKTEEDDDSRVTEDGDRRIAEG